MKVFQTSRCNKRRHCSGGGEADAISRHNSVTDADITRIMLVAGVGSECEGGGARQYQSIPAHLARDQLSICSPISFY
uniref:Uncharacterized protein n=1 Tax=Caenorhabditis tropicalis TaxID=1561998 RepID=A0A1I7UYX8_9PELO